MDKEPLRQLYHKYQKEIYLYLFSLCHSRELAEDLRQETFLKAILALPDDHCNMRAWLYMVARNLYLNSIRREKRNVAIDEIAAVSDEEENTTLEKLIKNEQKQMLYRALWDLPPAKREVLCLQYFSGLSQKEIAAILQETPENIRIKAYRGKKQLKSYMEVHGYDIP